jgi:hypothetical protein
MVIQKDEYFVGKTPISYQITANDVKMRALTFYVIGASSTVLTKDGGGVDIVGSEDYMQPFITVTASGETVPIKEGASSTRFLVETSISSRILDN